MNAFDNWRARLQDGHSPWVPCQPLFMIYAAEHIGETYEAYVRDYRVLVRGQMALLEDFHLDVVSCCSDAWREAADLGTELVYSDREPPFGMRPLLSGPESLARLRVPDPAAGGRMTDRLEAVRAFAAQVKGQVPILGWIEGPCAEAVDLLGMDAFMEKSLVDEDFVAELMDFVVEMQIAFATAQIEAGADIVGMGDAAASLVSPEYFEEFVAPRQKKIVDAIHTAGASVRTHICGSIAGKFASIAATGTDHIDVDYPQSLADVRAGAGNTVTLAGNLHPVKDVMKGSPESIRAGFRRCREEAGPRYILAAGCEVPPGTPFENVEALVAAAHELR